MQLLSGFGNAESSFCSLSLLFGPRPSPFTLWPRERCLAKAHEDWDWPRGGGYSSAGTRWASAWSAEAAAQPELSMGDGPPPPKLPGAVPHAQDPARDCNVLRISVYLGC